MKIFLVTHFLLRTTRYPVLFIFGKAEIDVEDCAKQFTEKFDDQSKVVIFYECRFRHAAEALDTLIRKEKKYENVHVTIMDTEFAKPKHEKELSETPESQECGTSGDNSGCCQNKTACCSRAPEQRSGYDFCGRRLGVPVEITEGSIFYIGDEEDEDVAMLSMAYHEAPVCTTLAHCC